MIKHEKAIETLRLNGHRLTPQRLIVLSIIASGDGHMGVDEVFQAAKKAYPYMDIADGYHHHMVCRACNGAFNLSPHYLVEFRDTLNNEFGFEPDLEHFAVSGICANCQEADSKTNGDRV